MAVLTKITSRSLADNAVSSAKIQDGAIAVADVADGSISTAKLADDAVTTAKIANDQVTAAKIPAGAVVADVGTGGIATTNLADDAVTSAKIATGAVIADGIGAGAVVTAGLGANAVTGAKIAAETIEVIPHIKPGTLYPAYLGNKLDGTATAASTTGPAGSTIASSRYGTVQSDGRMYYHTAINGSKPIKDPRIGSHFGSQRHKISSIQSLKQETATHGKDVYSIDGRDWLRVVGGAVAADDARGSHVLFKNGASAADGDFLEITGYFNKLNYLAFNEASRMGLDYHVNGGSATQTNDTQFTATTSPLDGRYVNAQAVHSINIGTITTPGINTVRLVPNTSTAAAHHQITGIELIAQDKFTDATCDTTSGDATVTHNANGGMSVGMSVTGTGILAGATIASVTSTTAFELSANATATNSNQTLTFGGSDMSIPPQNVVSYGKKFALSPQSLHYDPFAYKTDGITAWTSPTSGSNNHNGTAWPVGTGGSHNIDTATSLGLAAWVNTNYYRPYHGGRVVIWVDSSGNVKTSVNMMPPNARSIGNAANLTGGAEKGDDSLGNTSAATPNSNYQPTFTDQVTDHAQAEVAKTYHFREFGNGAANGNASYADASTVTRTGGNHNGVFVMDDGLSSLSFSTMYDYADTGLRRNSAGDFYFTFIGTGLTIKGKPYTSTVATNLPYGTHIFRQLANGSSGSGDGGDWFIDGVKVKTFSGASGSINQLGDHGILELTIHQPKMPPIPEDAVVIADYMLMADFVSLGASNNNDKRSHISKGVRRISGSRDVFYDNSAWTQSLGPGNASGFSYHGADNDYTAQAKITFFGDKVVWYYSDPVSRFVDGACTFSSGTKGTTVDISSTNTNTIGAREFNITNGSTLTTFTGDSTGASNSYTTKIGLIALDLHTPIHTSSHYQTFETPFLNELVGGDRNMEQTNLVVTPDGKTWDEVTRDVGYMGASTALNIHWDDSGATNGIIIWSEHRGGATSNHNQNKVNKGFAYGYDRVIILEDGLYNILCQTYSSALNVDFSLKLNNSAANGTGAISAMRIDPADETAYVINTMPLKRGDYLVAYTNFNCAKSNTILRITKIES